MAGMDENVPVFGDWFSSNASPRTLFSEMIAKEYGSRLISDDFLQRTSGGSLSESKEPGLIVNVKNHDSEPGIQVSKEILMELNSCNVTKSAARGGLSERIAGRAGFSNLTLDTSQIRKTTDSYNTLPTGDVHSPLLTIPPGLSPTTLLDSPIFIYNSMDDLSPSTGKLAFIECDNVTYTNVSSKIKNHTTEDADLPFSFKLPLTYYTCAETKPGLPIHQSNLQNGFPQLSEEKESSDTFLGKKDLNSNINDKHASLDEPQEGDIDRNPIEEFNSISLGTRGEVGFNWRKYGQKQVKGSDFPRSYYRCTYPNCEVKKKVERSHEGHITEIIYQGHHNHSNTLSEGEVQIEGLDQNDWKQDDLDANQDASVIEKIDQLYLEAPDDIKASLLLNDGDVEDEHVPHGNVSQGGDGDRNVNILKRKLDACALEMNAALRAIREPKIIVQTTSEVDILEDGYRWRKYGQKVVKGNPNPRSYYKCTTIGCTVRKHVERASHDLKSVMTTYEGKHNHEVPVARSNGQSSSLAALSTTTAVFSSCLLPKKAEPTRMLDSLDRFEAPLPLRSFFLPGTEQPLGAAVPNFTFGMGHQSLKPNFPMAALGNMPMNMPVRPPLSNYMPQHRPPFGAGFMVPKSMPNEQLAAESEPPVFGDSSVFRMLSMMPLGPQL